MAARTSRTGLDRMSGSPCKRKAVAPQKVTGRRRDWARATTARSWRSYPGRQNHCTVET
ncbi:hypothetical protein ACFFX0_19700 [Citricoccus parietis]|uniref:Uncharacterized protein n=1 Tax=Citricoccus parietis TaxID=592307 RepID=A0ABV5G2Z3_9MICC